MTLPILNPGARWGGWLTSRPGRVTPGNDPYPLCRRLGKPHGRIGRVRKILPPPESDPRTFQPVVSRYSHCHTNLIYSGPQKLFVNFLNYAVRM
jgi:hypothetical protein